MNPTPTDIRPTRQALMDAALSVFVERGFARATTREIARRAGLSEGAMYPQPVATVAKYFRAEQELGRIRPDVDATEAAAVIVSVPLAAGMEHALRANFAPSGESNASGEFPIPAVGALDTLARGLTL